MKTFKAIAAMSLNRVIGQNNQLPWNIPEELKWFKKMTLDQAILMGRKTFESIERPLPKRENIVLTHSSPTTPTKGIHYINQFSEINTDKTIWAIGGEQLYQMTLPAISDLYLTIVKLEIKGGDTFFPAFEDTFQFQEIITENNQFKIIHYVNPNPKDYESI